MARNTNPTPADRLAAIIAAGVARYQASLPDFARDAEPHVALPDHARIITLSEDRQRELCLSCTLADCVGTESSACPIRIEMRRNSRNVDEKRKAEKAGREVPNA